MAAASKKDDVASILQAEQPPSRSTIDRACKAAGAGTPPELLLLCAELAAEQQTDVFAKHAARCLELLPSSSTASAADSADEAQRVRACLVRAQLEAFAAASSGPLHKRAERIAAALADVGARVEELRVKHPRSGWLVHNATVVAWRVARPAMREGGSWGSLAGPLKTLSKALDESFPDSNHAWRARLQMSVARALEDAHRPSEAIAAAQQAYQTAMRSGKGDSTAAAVAATKAEAARLLVHICRSNPENLSRMRNELSAPAHKETRAHATLQQVVVSATKDRGSASATTTAVAAATPQDLKDVIGLAATSKSDELLAQTAIAAVVQPASAPAGFAAEATQKLRASKNLKARALANLARCELALREVVERREATHPGSSACVGPTEAADSQALAELLRQLVAVLDSAVRSFSGSAHPGDEFPTWGSVVEEGVSLVWRTSLPLLQHFKRGQQTKAALLTAVAALQAVSSTDARMARRLHQQIARCELAEDNSTRATVHARLAFANADDASNVDDLADLAPLLRGDAQRDESALPALERAQIALSKAQDLLLSGTTGVNRGMARELLMSAIGLLESSAPTRGRALLLHSVVLEASRAGFVEVVRRGHVLWHKASATEFFLSTEGQVLTVAVVYAYGDALVQSSPAAALATAAAIDDVSAATAPAAALDEAQLAGVKEILRGARIAAKSGEALLVTNGLALVWRALSPWVRRARWAVVHEHLVDGFLSLAELDPSRVDAPLFGPFAIALLRSFLEIGSSGPEEDFLPETRTAKATPLEAQDSAMVDDIVKMALKLRLSALARRELAAMVAKLNSVRPSGTGALNLQAQQQAAEGERDLALLVAVESLAFERDPAKKADVLHKLLPTVSAAFALSPTKANDACLLGRLAVEALEIGEFDTALQLASQGAPLLPASALASATRDQLRWVSVCKFVVGKALLRDVRPGVALTGSMVPAAFRASLAFAEAVTLAARAHEPDLLVRCAHAFFGAASPLSQTRATRKLLGEPLEVVARAAAAASGRCPDELLARLYCLALECILETPGLASRGADLADEALRRLPKQYHAEVWRSKAVLLTSTGSGSVTPEMLGASGEDARAQAQMYARIAWYSSGSTSEEAQQLWLDRALQALQQLPIDRAEFLNDYAAWMLSHKRPASAVDVLLREGIMRLRSAFEPAPAQPQAASMPTSQRSQRHSARSTRTTMTRVSVRPRSPHRTTTAASSAAQQSGVGAPQPTIPVQTPLCQEDKLSVQPEDAGRYWLVLSRLYLALGIVSPACSSSASELASFATLSYGAFIRLSETLFGQSFKVSSATVEDWAMLDASKLPALPKWMVSAWSSVIWHCRTLADVLIARGCDLLAVPLLRVVLLVLRSLGADSARPALIEAASKRTLLTICAVLDRTGMHAAQALVRRELGAILPSQSALASVQQQEKQLAALEQLARSAADISHIGRSAAATADGHQSRKQSASAAAQTKPTGPAAVQQQAGLHTALARELSVEEEWLETAKLLVEEGQYKQAKQLATSALVQARLHSDRWIEGWCSHVLAIIAGFEHFADYSLSLEQDAIQLAGSDVSLLADCARYRMELPGDSARKLAAATDALRILEAAQQDREVPAFAVRKVVAASTKLALTVAKASPKTETNRRMAAVQAVQADIARGGSGGVVEMLLNSIRASKLAQATTERISILSSAIEVGISAVSASYSGPLPAPLTASIPVARVLAHVQLALSDAQLEHAEEAAKCEAETSGMNVVERYLASAAAIEDVPVSTI